MSRPAELPARRRRIGVRRTFGLVPFRKALSDARLAIAGSPHTAATRFGLSSLRIFKPGTPWVSPHLHLNVWLGGDLGFGRGGAA